MVDNSVKLWVKFFFAGLRREANNTHYKYKGNISRIRKASLKQNELALKDSNRVVIELTIDSELSKASLNQVREILLKDTQAPPDALLRIFRNGRLPRQGLNQNIHGWSRESQLFEHPIIPRYGLPLLRHGTNKTDYTFNMNQTVKLSSKDNKEILSRVLWPQTIFSRACRGIGVPSTTFNRLKQDYGENLPEFVNPSNKTVPLKIYPVDFDLEGCQAIGLFPSYIMAHRLVFKGLDLFAALTGSNLCGDRERKLMDQQITTSDCQKLARTEGVDVQAGDSNTALQVQGNIRNLHHLRLLYRKYNKLWSKESHNDKSCPEDILRNVLLTRNITTIQLKEEFFKHFILFCVFSQAWRLDLKLNDLGAFKNSSLIGIPWKPWDLYIWQKSKTLDTLPIPATLQELTDVKLEFDQFLSELFNYFSFITAEMKANADSFFTSGETVAPRAIATHHILRRILVKMQWVRRFYPNLQKYMKNNLKGAREVNHMQIPVLSEDELQWYSTNRLFAIIQQILELEHIVFHDKLSDLSKMSHKGPTTDWKVVLLCNPPIEDEISRLLKFSTTISVQFVQTLDQVDDSLWVCRERKMIDSDTFLYLYQTTNLEPLSKNDLINNIITKLAGPDASNISN
ncbi:CBP2 (YHL038C) [Zygosaccharomyces parabailii]|nr:CBP2 (YHL038C) [Zygosaccharomyces parabailii]